jgi:hypothetical protein
MLRNMLQLAFAIAFLSLQLPACTFNCRDHKSVSNATTPREALTEFEEAVRQGNESRIRALCLASTPEAKLFLDDLCRVVRIGRPLSLALDQRFPDRRPILPYGADDMIEDVWFRDKTLDYFRETVLPALVIEENRDTAQVNKDIACFGLFRPAFKRMDALWYVDIDKSCTAANEIPFLIHRAAAREDKMRNILNKLQSDSYSNFESLVKDYQN